MNPGAITVERHGQDWIITLERIDGSQRTVAAVFDGHAADLIADEYRKAILNGEPGVLSLIDVSAGELRS